MIRFRLLRPRGYAPATQQPERSRSEREGEITEGLLHYFEYQRARFEWDRFIFEFGASNFQLEAFIFEYERSIFEYGSLIFQFGTPKLQLERSIFNAEDFKITARAIRRDL
jgi:hypothetical protein